MQAPIESGASAQRSVNISHPIFSDHAECFDA
jgi:hypothetical protein